MTPFCGILNEFDILREKIFMKLAFKKRSERDLSRPFVRNMDMLALGIGDLGYSMISGSVATYIVSFGTMALIGVGENFAALMAIAVGIAVIFDAISDPIVGYLSDRYRNKVFGKRHLFMLIGLVGMMLCALAIWLIPYREMTDIGRFFWFAFFLILIRTFNTLYFTPVSAFSVEISNNYDERTTIQAVRSVFYIIGMLLPVLLMGNFQNRFAGFYSGTDLIAAGKTEELARVYAAEHDIDLTGLYYRRGQQVAEGYRLFAYVATGICVLTSITLFACTFRYVKGLNKKQELAEAATAGGDAGKRRRTTLKEVLKNFFSTFKIREMRIISLGYAVSMISATLLIALGFNVYTFTFRLRTTQMYVLMGGLLVMTVLCQPFWMILAKKKSKQFTMMIGLIISFAGCLLIFASFLCRDELNVLITSFRSGTSWGGAMLLLPSVMVAGAGTGVLYSMPLALVGDVVTLRSEKDKDAKVGTYAGVMTFSYKISQGITTTVSTALLAAIGFIAGQAEQTYEASKKMGLILCVGVTVAMALGIVIFSRLKLDKEKISDILSRQNEEMAKINSELAMEAAAAKAEKVKEKTDAKED